MTAVSAGTGTRPVTRVRRRVERPHPGPYLNRELAWLDFNARVLHEARDERNPILERVKFLSIFASNLDEFFQARSSGLGRQHPAGPLPRTPAGRAPAERLHATRGPVIDLLGEHSAMFA